MICILYNGIFNRSDQSATEDTLFIHVDLYYMLKGSHDAHFKYGVDRNLWSIDNLIEIQFLHSSMGAITSCADLKYCTRNLATWFTIGLSTELK